MPADKGIEIIAAEKSPHLRDDVYLTATKLGNLVFMVGQVSVDPVTCKLVEGDLKTHYRRACENMKLALEDADTSIDNNLTMRFVLLDMKHYPILAEARKEYFPTRPPSTTVAMVGIGPQGKGCVEVDCIAAKDQKTVKIETVLAKKSPSLRSDIYSVATKFGELVFMTGQVAVDPKTNQLIEGDLETQIRRACENLKLALEDAGTSTENILTMRFFLRDTKDYRILAKVRKEYFPTRPPSTTVAVAGIGPLGKGRIEVDCIAARDQKTHKIEFVTAKKSPHLRDDVYLTASKFGGLVFMTGQVSVDPKTNKLIEGDLEGHFRRACDNLNLALEDAGASIDRILTMRFFLKDMKDYLILAKVRKEYFPTRPPSTRVAVAGIGPGGKGCVEVDCIAATGI